MTAIISEKGTTQELLYLHLLDSEKSLFNQASARSDALQKDGWGIGFFKNGKTVSILSPNPVFKEKEKFASALKKAAGSKIVIAHIRDASNPGKLPRHKLISKENIQPFNDGKYLFAHNGTLFIAQEIRKNLGFMEKEIHGNNDSEILFLELLKTAAAYGSLEKGLEMARDEIKTVWISASATYSAKGFKTPYRGLNILVSDGSSVYALCDYESEKYKDALKTPGWEWGRYAFYRGDSFAILSSEPTAAGSGWEKFSQGSLTVISVKGEKISERKIK